jgi:hypothetical protein
MMPAVATRTAVEVVRFTPELERLPALFTALCVSADEAGIHVELTDRYRGGSEWLLFWGPGAPARAAAMRDHVAAGGHAMALDLAYWSRARKFRVSIDAPHPQRWVMQREWPRSRLTDDCPPIRNTWDPTGPIIVAGIGRKAQVQYGAAAVDNWERLMIMDCRRRWPGRRVIRRPKPTTGGAAPIDAVLDRASLVVTWHSNVAVDAIRHGIPVICRDGAAAAVCPSALGSEDPQPLTDALRDRFLTNLAWFQWAPEEAVGFWVFLRELLG